MRDFFDFLEILIPVAVWCAAIYGFICFGRFCFMKITEKLTGSSDGKLTYEQKKNILDVVKLFGGAQLLGLLFYITPVINENIKILVSLLIMLGGFVGAFLIKEKNEDNNISRTLVFLGQEFFGITMLLLMVHKGMGYSVTSIFVIWTVFNFLVYRQFNKFENKTLLVGTLIISIFALLIESSNYLDTHSAILCMSLILVALHFFGKSDSIFIKVIHNFILTIFALTVFVSIGMQVDNQELIFANVLVYTVITVVLQVVRRRFEVKAFLVYLPYLAVVILSEPVIELLWIVSIFNIFFTMWLTADKDLYKKLLCAIGLFFMVIIAEEFVNVDKLIGGIIYMCATVFTFTYLFTPTKPVTIAEGGENNEE